MTKTITVTSAFGSSKKVTQRQFVKAWAVSVSELHCLATSATDAAEIAAIKERVAQLASGKFHTLANAD